MASEEIDPWSHKYWPYVESSKAYGQKNLQATLLFVDFTKAFDSIHRGKMEQILLAYGLPKETVAAIMILYRNTKVKVRSPDGDTEYFDIVAGVLQGDTLAPYLFIICLDYILRISIDKIRKNGFELTKRRSKRYTAKTITDADYADDLALLANTLNQAETLLHSLERATAGIGLHVNAHKTEYMCYNQTGNIATLDGASLKLVDKFIYLGSSVSSTEKDIDTRLTKAWTAIDRLSIIWKSDLTDKMKRSFFQAAVVSILLYGYTTWTLTKRLEKKLDGNYTRMLRAVLNKSWRQQPTTHQLYGHFPSITKTIQVRRTRHAGHCWISKDELISDVLLWTPIYGRAKAGRPARTYTQQLCEDTECNPEDLPEAVNDREKWRERVRDIRAAGTTWWWSLVLCEMKSVSSRVWTRVAVFISYDDNHYTTGTSKHAGRMFFRYFRSFCFVCIIWFCPDTFWVFLHSSISFDSFLPIVSSDLSVVIFLGCFLFVRFLCVLLS